VAIKCGSPKLRYFREMESMRWEPLRLAQDAKARKDVFMGYLLSVPGGCGSIGLGFYPVRDGIYGYQSKLVVL
jgi:hypothetical protein